MNAEDKVEVKYIGTRHGEKLYESLLSSEESARSIDLGDYFKVPLDTRTLDYQAYFQKGNSSQHEFESYNSHNTTQLSVDEVVSLIENLDQFKKLIESTSK
jgi:UDP-glucose 4-epimerase